jgi:thiol-disulfide isomerase/thioredoxin
LNSINLFLKSMFASVLVLSATAMAQGQNKTAPDFTLTDTSGTKFSLSQFNGKVVYLDIWATWCGPCIKEIPYAEELHEQLKNNPDVVFINLSFDKDTLRWKKKIAEKNMSGLHLLSPGGAESNVRVNYDVKSIPRFVIINKDGTIEDFDAKRPSDKGIAKALTKLTEKQK